MVRDSDKRLYVSNLLDSVATKAVGVDQLLAIKVGLKFRKN